MSAFNTETPEGFRAAHPGAQLQCHWERAKDSYGFNKWLAVLALHAPNGIDKLLLTLETFNGDISRREMSQRIIPAWIEYATEHEIWEPRV